MHLMGLYVVALFLELIIKISSYPLVKWEVVYLFTSIFPSTVHSLSVLLTHSTF